MGVGGLSVMGGMFIPGVAIGCDLLKHLGQWIGHRGHKYGMAGFPRKHRGLRAVGRNPDGRMGLLQGFRYNTGLRNFVIAAVIRKRFMRPGLFDDVEAFLEAFAALVPRAIKACKMKRDRPASDAELQPPVTQQIDRCTLFRVADRVPERQEVDGNAQGGCAPSVAQ